MLIPLFALSWWIEGRVVRRAGECSKVAVAWAVGVANLLSYGAMIAYVQLTPSVPEIAPSYTTRTILYDGFRAAQVLEPQVEAFWAVHRRFPVDAGELGNVGEPYDTSREFGVRLEADGRIALRFHAPHHRHLDGKQIRLTPTPPVVPEGGRLEWRCRSPDLHPELLGLLTRLRAQCSPE